MVIFSPVAAMVSSVKQTLQTSFLQEVVNNKIEPTATNKTFFSDCIVFGGASCVCLRDAKISYFLHILKQTMNKIKLNNYQSSHLIL